MVGELFGVSPGAGGGGGSVDVDVDVGVDGDSSFTGGAGRFRIDGSKTGFG